MMVKKRAWKKWVRINAGHCCQGQPLLFIDTLGKKALLQDRAPGMVGHRFLRFVWPWNDFSQKSLKLRYILFWNSSRFWRKIHKENRAWVYR